MLQIIDVILPELVLPDTQEKIPVEIHHVLSAFALRFEVNNYALRSIDNPPVSLSHFKTEINIFQSVDITLVKAPDIIE